MAHDDWFNTWGIGVDEYGWHSSTSFLQVYKG
jgi:hypothetical protein